MLARTRVLHYVSGVSSSAAQIAIDLARAHQEGRRFEPLLVVRTRPDMDLERVELLREMGLAVELLPAWNGLASFWGLWRLCRRLRPALLVAHAFPDHLLGRWVALAAGVPYRVQVEHRGGEPYSRWQLRQTRWLSRRTQAIVGVSAGVEQALLRQGLPPERVHAIPNGIDVSRFTAVPAVAARAPGLVMTARFTRQKDHATLIRALAILRDEHGLTPPLQLAGSGRLSHQQAVEGLAQRLKLKEQVRFLGYEPKVAELLKRTPVFVLSTRWESMPLALVEAMAAGCACVATLVPGVEGVVEHGKTGLLVPPEDPRALAQAIAMLMKDTALAERLADAARERALGEHGLPQMRERYERLFSQLVGLAP